GVTLVAAELLLLANLIAGAIEPLAQFLDALGPFVVLTLRARPGICTTGRFRLPGCALAAASFGVADVLVDEPFERAALGIIQRRFGLGGVQSGLQDFQRRAWLALDERHGFLDRVANVGFRLLGGDAVEAPDLFKAIIRLGLHAGCKHQQSKTYAREPT